MRYRATMHAEIISYLIEKYLTIAALCAAHIMRAANSTLFYVGPFLKCVYSKSAAPHFLCLLVFN
jgi:hypothetical protein